MEACFLKTSNEERKMSETATIRTLMSSHPHSHVHPTVLTAFHWLETCLVYTQEKGIIQGQGHHDVGVMGDILKSSQYNNIPHNICRIDVDVTSLIPDIADLCFLAFSPIRLAGVLSFLLIFPMNQLLVSLFSRLFSVFYLINLCFDLYYCLFMLILDFIWSFNFLVS